MADVRSILALSNQGLQSLTNFLESAGIGKLEPRHSATCSSCGKIARVEDQPRGICRCDDGHKTEIDPESLVTLTVNDDKVLKLVQKLTKKALEIEIPTADTEEFLPFHASGFHLVGQTATHDMRIAILLPLRKLELRDACGLLGFLAFMPEDVFLVLTDSISEEAKLLLSYRSNAAIQLCSLSRSFENPQSLADAVKEIPVGASGETIRLANWIRTKFRTLRSVVSPAHFRRMVEFDDSLVNESFHAATHGMSAEFEDSVAALLGSILPTTQLGHSSEKIEVPDGVVIIPSEKTLRLLFFDCKSVGTASKEQTIKSISQTDEDEFVRYVDLFNDTRIAGKLVAGCFIANDFSDANIVNKALQIRKRVTNEVRIVFWPLRSLVKAYSAIATKRQLFQTHFQPHHFGKLLGVGLNKMELKKLEADPRFAAYSKVKSPDMNSIFVIETLVDVFLEDVWNSPAMDESFMPFLVDRARRASVRG